MISPVLQKNDTRANWLIICFSVIVFCIVAALGKLPKQNFDLGFNVHLFATANAVINSIVSVLLVVALFFAKQKKYVAHRNTMYAAMVLSILFLVCYISHHLLTGGGTKYGGDFKLFYYILLITHIFLAAIILPFILFTAYRGMTGEYVKHRKLAKYTWPLWLYVSVTGPVVYLMISPYYS
jgi:putative membrane protein